MRWSGKPHRFDRVSSLALIQRQACKFVIETYLVRLSGRATREGHDPVPNGLSPNQQTLPVSHVSAIDPGAYRGLG